MRPEGVVFPTEVLDNDSSFGERPELLPIEAFVAESSVEAFHVAVLPRAAGFDVDRLDPILREPLLNRLGDELTPIVASQERRGSVLLDRPTHPLQDIPALERPIRP